MKRFVIALAALFGASASAQPAERVPIEAAVAQTIISALPLDTWDASWSYNWNALGSRLLNDADWHLIGRAEDGDIVHRTGWTIRGFRQSGIGVCGREQVIGMSFSFGGEVEGSTAALLEALRAQDVDVQEREDGVYAVSPRGRDAGLIAFSGDCTSPRSRAAQRCWTDVRLAFRDAHPNDPVMLACQSP